MQNHVRLGVFFRKSPKPSGRQRVNAGNASLFVCLHGCAIACATKQALAQCRIFLERTLLLTSDLLNSFVYSAIACISFLKDFKSVAC